MERSAKTFGDNVPGEYSPERTGALIKASAGALRCRRIFLGIFPGGFRDPDFLGWERNYKWEAHQRWAKLLDPKIYRSLLRRCAYREIADLAVGIEGRTHLIFSFEKMAVRDAVRSPDGAESFARGLYAYLYGPGSIESKFDRWCEVVAELPRKQSRVSTWPVVTVFGFIAQPEKHIYLKPNVTRHAAEAYGFDFQYDTRPSRTTYSSLLEFTKVIRADLKDLRPRDMIDMQSFIWVMGSDEYS